MSRTRRVTALLLSILLLLSLATGAFAASCTYSSWFASEYAEIQNLGILPSAFSGLDLTKPITRGEMCELAVVAFEKATGNSIELDSTDYFSDTSDTNICKAYEYGIVSGYQDGTFRPDNNLTRQEFFQIVKNFASAASYKTENSSASLGKFADSGSVSSWAQDATSFCVACGFVNGTVVSGSTYLKPESNTSRQEAMAMFLRCYKTVRQYYNQNVTNAKAVNTTYYTTTAVRIRKEPSTLSDSNIITTLSSGQSVTVLIASVEGHSGWSYISYNGSGAYISSQYLTTTKPVADTPTTPVYTDNNSGSQTVSGTGTGAEIANFALSFVGSAYVWGGTSPSGFDCSGLVYYCYRYYGITSINRVADDQMNQGTAITSQSDLQAGDLVFFGSGDYANHVGIYIGNGNFVHASTPATGVRVNSLSETYYRTRYIGARRIVS